MFSSLILTLALIAAVSPYEIVHDAQGQRYYLVPIHTLHRQRRETNINIQPGPRITVGQQGNIVNSGGHSLDGGAFASKQFRPSGPTTVGGQLGYSHAPSGSKANVGVQHTQRFGTDVSANGRANIWSGGNARLDAVGSYNKHFGGMGGTGSSGYYAGLEYKMQYGY